MLVCNAHLRQALFTDQERQSQDKPTLLRHQYFTNYLEYMVLWARFLSNNVTEPGLNSLGRSDIDSGIRSFLESDIAQLQAPYHLSTESTEASPHKIFLLQVRNNLLLKGFRAELLSLAYDNEKVASFLWLASSTLEHMRSLSCASRSFRHHQVTSIAGALLAFCSLLVHGAQNYGSLTQDQRESCKQGFRDAVAMLNDLGYSLPYARRVYRDLAQIISTVTEIINETTDPVLLLTNVAEQFPYRGADNVPLLDREHGTDFSETTALWYC